MFTAIVLSALLRFEVVNLGGRHVLSKKLERSQRGDLSPVVVLYKDGDALDALVFAVLDQYIVGVFFQVLGGQFEGGGRIDVPNVFESEVDAIDKEQDACNGIWKMSMIRFVFVLMGSNSIF